MGFRPKWTLKATKSETESNPILQRCHAANIWSLTSNLIIHQQKQDNVIALCFSPCLCGGGMPSRWVLVGLFHPWDFIGSWLVPTDLSHYRSSAKPWRTTSSPPLGMLWFGGRSTSKNFLNTTDMPSNEEAASGDSKVDSPILMAELAKGVKKLLSGTRSDIHLKFLKVLDGRLSWLTLEW